MTFEPLASIIAWFRNSWVTLFCCSITISALGTQAKHNDKKTPDSTGVLCAQWLDDP